MPRITELYAWVVADADDDDEGVPAFTGPSGMAMPMMGADMEMAMMLRPKAQEIASLYGKSLRLVRSTVLEEVEVIEPNGTSE